MAVSGSAQLNANGGDAESNQSGGGGGGVVVVITSTAQPAGVTLSARGGHATDPGTDSDGGAGFTDWLN